MRKIKAFYRNHKPSRFFCFMLGFTIMGILALYSFSLFIKDYEIVPEGEYLLVNKGSEDNWCFQQNWNNN